MTNTIGPPLPYWDTTCSHTTDPNFRPESVCGMPSIHHIMTTMIDEDGWVGVFVCEDHYNYFNPLLIKMIHPTDYLCGAPDSEWELDLNICFVDMERFEKAVLG